MSLDELIRSAGENMTLDLRRRLIEHPGELGTAREEIIRRFLRSHLPRKFEVSTGFAFDCNGDLSKQLDIVIFDADVCPRFEIPGGKFLFPCEAIVAVGQVKSSMSKLDDLRSSIDNLATVKSLDRSANGEAYDFRFGEQLLPDENHLHQIFTFVFLVGDALEPETVAGHIMESAFEISVHLLPNLVLALDRYLVTYCCDGGVCPNPLDARGVAIQEFEEPSDAILRFYLLLGQALNTTRSASLPYWQYLSKYRDMEATVFHSTVETPPPHLGRWSEEG